MYLVAISQQSNLVSNDYFFFFLKYEFLERHRYKLLIPSIVIQVTSIAMICVGFQFNSSDECHVQVYSDIFAGILEGEQK